MSMTLSEFAQAQARPLSQVGVRQARALRLPRRDTVLYPASCLHWPLTDRDVLAAWVERVRDTHGLVFLLGDSFDWARAHLRRHVKAYQDDESSPEQIDTWHARDVRDLARVLEPIKGKIVGLLRGNHYHLNTRSIDSEQLLARELGVAYLGVESAVRLDFTGRGVVDSIVVHCAHGDGGGRTWGGDLNAVMRMFDVVDADIVMAGHTHKAFALKVPRDYVSREGEPEVRARERVLVRAGNFRSREEPYPSAETPYVAPYRAIRGYPGLPAAWTEVHVLFTPQGRRLQVRF